MKKLIILVLLLTACGTKKHTPCPAYGKANAEMTTKDLALLDV